MTAFITTLDADGDGPRLAVKDVIDVAGVPTTGGSRALAETATPAGADAACLKGARAAGARIIGKANLHELALGATGVNPWFGTPPNPLDPGRVPGGSSSGSTVAVATGDADVGLGTDTGGSTRIPPACCGVAGLKTTHGRIPLDGVLPLAPSLDTVGPIARDVAGLVLGMQLLEPGFTVAPGPSGVGRVRLPADPDIDAAVDAALRNAEVHVTDADLPGWDAAYGHSATVLLVESARTHGRLLQGPAPLGDDIAGKLTAGRDVAPSAYEAALIARELWRAGLADLIARVGVLALPTLPVAPPGLDGDMAAAEVDLSRLTLPVNLAGFPAVTLPVGAGEVIASLQLIGRDGEEEQLLGLAARIEAANR